MMMMIIINLHSKKVYERRIWLADQWHTQTNTIIQYSSLANRLWHRIIWIKRNNNDDDDDAY